MSAEVALRDIDAIELAELLEFVWDLLAAAPAAFAGALAHHCGDGYGLEDLRADLARFAFLLGSDGQRFVDGADR